MATKPDKPVDEMHVVNARPEDVRAYRQKGFQTPVFRGAFRHPGLSEGFQTPVFRVRPGGLTSAARATFLRRVLDKEGRFDTFVHYCHCGHGLRRERLLRELKTHRAARPRGAIRCVMATL